MMNCQAFVLAVLLLLLSESTCMLFSSCFCFSLPPFLPPCLLRSVPSTLALIFPPHTFHCAQNQALSTFQPQKSHASINQLVLSLNETLVKKRKTRVLHIIKNNKTRGWDAGSEMEYLNQRVTERNQVLPLASCCLWQDHLCHSLSFLPAGHRCH